MSEGYIRQYTVDEGMINLDLQEGHWKEVEQLLLDMLVRCLMRKKLREEEEAMRKEEIAIGGRYIFAPWLSGHPVLYATFYGGDPDLQNRFNTQGGSYDPNRSRRKQPGEE